MAIITDSQMKHITDLLGQAYIASKDAIGDEDTPGTSSFEIAKLMRYVENRNPSEGIISGCRVQIPTDTSNVRVLDGTLMFDDEQMSVSQQDVSVTRTFQYPFDATDQYGVMVAFKRDEVSASMDATRTTLDADLTTGVSTSVSVTDTSVLSNYDVPFSIQVGTETIEVWKIDDDGDGVISPSYNGGTPASSHSSGDVAYVSKPLTPKVIVGLPVSTTYQSGDDPTTFDYYPPVSVEDYIILGRGLVTGPTTTTVDRTPELVAVEDMRDTVDTVSEDMFTESEQEVIQAAAEMFNVIISYQAGFGGPEDVLSDLVTWSNDETGTDFSSYWDDRPFTPAENYLKGESFWGISRFETSEDFKEMYYDLYSTELLTTLVIFRGDIYGGQQTYGTTPTGLSGNYESVSDSSLGNLSYGRWIYRVTAITSSGESSPSGAVSVKIPSSAGSTNKVTLSWDAVSGATSYNIYRLGSEGYKFIEYKLTSDGEVTGTTYEDLGTTAGTSVKRGVLTTGDELQEASRLVVYVPPMEGNFTNFLDGADLTSSYDDSETAIQNEMDVTIYGVKSDGTVGGPHTVNVPQGTTRGTKFYVGQSTDLYVAIDDITVAPGDDLTTDNGRVAWSPYDTFVVQNV